MFCFVYLSNDTATPPEGLKKKKNAPPPKASEARRKLLFPTRPLLIGDIIRGVILLSNAERLRVCFEIGYQARIFGVEHMSAIGIGFRK